MTVTINKWAEEPSTVNTACPVVLKTSHCQATCVKYDVVQLLVSGY